MVIKANGVGVFDRELLEGVVRQSRRDAVRIFWDVDAAATLDEMRGDPSHPVTQALPHLDMVLTYGGGPPVVAAYEGFGADVCVPIYNALDPETHHPAPPDERFASDLAFLGNRLPDREARVEEFFLRAAAALPDQSFLIGGNGWHDKGMSANVRHLGHVGTADHNAFNCTPRAVLNVARDSMADVGFSPATRVFEAAGAAACLITDAWEGIEQFLEPDREVLVARDGQDVADHMAALTEERARAIGQAALARVLADHTYDQRGETGRSGPARPPRAGGGGVRLVVLGLSLGSSWGNGHATTFRALLKAFAARGHDILFLERAVPWYAGAHRDLIDPDYCRLAYYADLAALDDWREEIAAADAVIVGSYVPEGVAVGRIVQGHARGVTAFYDIDTPVTLAKLARGDFEYLAPEIIPGYGVYLSFTGGPTLDRLEREFGSPAARALYCSVDDDKYRPLDVPKRWDLTYLGTYSDDRQPTLERLLIEPARRRPDLTFAVAGPQYPDTIAWPENVDRIEHLPPAEHAAFYSASRMTLNVTRADMIAAGWSPSVRLFEAGACGTPILSDRWAGLDQLFAPAHEILLADTTEDALTALATDAGLIGTAARTRVLAEHTARHRAAELEAHLRERADAKLVLAAE